MLIHDNRITKRISKAKIQSLESWSHLGYIGFNSRLLTAWEQLVVEHGGRSNVGRGDAKRASRHSRRSRVLASSRSFPPLSLDRNSDWIYNFLRVRDEDATRINVLCLTYPRGPTFRQSRPESRMTLRTYVRRMWIVCIIRFSSTSDCMRQKCENQIVNSVFAVHWINRFKDALHKSHFNFYTEINVTRKYFSMINH